MTPKAKIFSRLVGGAIGLAVAAGFVVAGLMPASEAALGGARLTIRAEPTAELAVNPAGRFLSASSLEPGPARAGVTAETTITNQTADLRAVRVKAVGPPGRLGDLVRVVVGAHGRTLIRGSLRRLRNWSEHPFALDPGASAELQVRVWLPRSASDVYAARTAELTLALASRPAGAR